jgi:hypothetical protein
VKARQWEQHKNYKAKVEVDGNPNSRWSPPYKYLFSGMLKCSVCGHSYTKTGSADRYGCSGFTNRGAAICPNNLTVSRVLLETKLLDAIGHVLTGDEIQDYFIKEATAILSAEKGGLAPGIDSRKMELEAANKRIDNIMNAIMAGIITPTMKEELEKAEAERGLLRTEIEVCSRQMQKVGAILPGAKEKFKIMLADLQTALKREIPKARTIVKQILGETIMINVVENRKLQAELSPNLLEILGFSTHSRIGLVAGAAC